MAQATKPEQAKTPAGSKLKMVVILSRHGVRSPTWTQDRLNAYSSLPWPDWSVPPGDLTAHGHELLKLFGAFDRATLADAGLFESDGCKDAGASYIWADTDERTLESGHALAEGLFPGCAPMVHSRAPGTNDPLFHPAAGVKQNEVGADFATAEVRRKGHSESQDAAQQDELIAEVQRVLLGCSPATACTPAHSP